jgi:hypothetical protein
MANLAPNTPAQDEGWSDLTSELAHAAELSGLHPRLQRLRSALTGRGTKSLTPRTYVSG